MCVLFAWVFLVLYGYDWNVTRIVFSRLGHFFIAYLCCLVSLICLPVFKEYWVLRPLTKFCYFLCWLFSHLVSTCILILFAYWLHQSFLTEGFLSNVSIFFRLGILGIFFCALITEDTITVFIHLCCLVKFGDNLRSSLSRNSTLMHSFWKTWISYLFAFRDLC